MMTGIGVQHRSESVFTFDRNPCSRWSGIRSYHGWNHHAVIAALTCMFLQLERRRGTTPLPTFSEVRNWVREIVAALYFVETPRLMKLALSFLRDPPVILRPHRAPT